MTFRAKEKEYSLKMSDQKPEIDDDSIRWIRSPETIRTFQTEFTKFEDIPEEQIDYIFTIYHTHGA